MKNLDLVSNNNKTPKLVIVGRANVGKSSLFNRISQSRKAIVGNREGITVDQQEIFVENSPIDKPFILIDTGGVGGSLEDHYLGDEIERVAENAVQNADVVLFVVDGSKGLHSEDEKVSLWLRRRLPKNRQVPVWTMINKADRKDFDPSSFYSLGFDEYFDISCEHNLGFNDFWEKLQSLELEETEFEKAEVKSLNPESQVDAKILVLGRPNMGKSSLINKLIGQDRHVVSEHAGTTRDIITSTLNFKNYTWNICDTAGLRRPGRREREVEWVASEKVKDLAKRSQVALVLIDANEGITDMDATICGFALESGLSLALLYNKWDLVKGKTKEDKIWNLQRTEDLKLDFISYVPRIKISAKTGKGLNELMPIIHRLIQARNSRIQTSKLNKVFEMRIQNREHPGVEGTKRVRFYYLSQISVNPPEFVMFTNVEANRIHFSFRRYVVNVLREEFGFEGCPLKVHFKKRE